MTSRRIFFLLLLFISLLPPLSTYAKTESLYPFAEEARAKQFNGLLKELRCLVCQNQDLADSNAELALDLKRIVYKKVSAGESNQMIKDYLVVRYGDFVSFYPPLNQKTYLLWFGPLFLLIAALSLMLLTIKRRRQ